MRTAYQELHILTTICTEIKYVSLSKKCWLSLMLLNIHEFRLEYSLYLLNNKALIICKM